MAEQRTPLGARKAPKNYNYPAFGEAEDSGYDKERGRGTCGDI